MSFRRTGWTVKEGEEKSYTLCISFLTRTLAQTHSTGSK